jgi:hypothetical protein
MVAFSIVVAAPPLMTAVIAAISCSHCIVASVRPSLLAVNHYMAKLLAIVAFS